jgi:hypothetical protein
MLPTPSWFEAKEGMVLRKVHLKSAHPSMWKLDELTRKGAARVSLFAWSQGVWPGCLFARREPIIEVFRLVSYPETLVVRGQARLFMLAGWTAL